MYRTVISDAALKDLENLPQNYQRLVLDRVASLSRNPRPRGCKKLDDRFYRVRQGSYRIIYEVNERGLEITVMKIKARREAYR
ncbi:MAG: type II toxin-antitoxin system RelE/ParE family toxin [Pseudomonadota bacterium]